MMSCMRLTKCAALCLFAVAFIATQANGDDELENVIGDNPSFEAGFQNWWQGIQGGAEAVMEVDNKDVIDEKRCAYVDVTKITGTDWHVGLTHELLPLEEGEMYTLDFFAKADATRVISIEVKRTPGNDLPYEGVTSQAYIITDEWAEYSKTFTPTKDYPDENGQTAQVAFWLGQVEGEVWIDGVRIYAGPKQAREEAPPEKSVEAEGKSITSWASIKTSY